MTQKRICIEINFACQKKVTSPFRVRNMQERNNDHTQLLKVESMSLEYLIAPKCILSEDEEDEDGDNNTDHDCDDDRAENHSHRFQHLASHCKYEALHVYEVKVEKSEADSCQESNLGPCASALCNVI